MAAKLARISKLLRDASIAHLVEPSQELDVVDDEITISPTVSLQVGAGYMNVTVDCGEEGFELIPVTEQSLVARLKEVM